MPKNTLKSVLRVFVPTYVLVAVLLLVVQPKAAVGVIIGVGVVALIIGIEVPLLLRAQDRRQQRVLDAMPPGSLFASRASLLPTQGTPGLPLAGVITFGRAGVDFAPKKSNGGGWNLGWEDMAQIKLGPAPRGVGAGRLSLASADGRVRIFAVPRYGAMAKVLAQQP